MDHLTQTAWDYQYQQQRHVWRDVNRHVPVLPENSIILELGCGNGKTAAGILLQNIDQLLGVDFSKKAIQLCKERFNADSRAQFLVGEITHLPFESHSFDFILCVHTLGHLLERDRTKAIHEMKRVLKKNGLIYFEDFGFGDLRSNKGKKIENGTVERGNGLYYHYFTQTEIKSLFSSFQLKSLKRVIESKKLGKEEVTRVEWRGLWTTK